MLGAQPQLFVTPLRLPGEEKGLGDEVGEHAQYVFCELHKVRAKTLEGLGSCGSCRTQQSGTRTPRSSTRTRTHRNHHRNDDR